MSSWEVEDHYVLLLVWVVLFLIHTALRWLYWSKARNGQFDERLTKVSVALTAMV